MIWILLAITIAVVSSLIAYYRRSPPPNSPSFGGITAPVSPDFGGIEVIDGDTVRRAGASIGSSALTLPRRDEMRDASASAR